MTTVDVQQRFLRGLADAAALPRDALDRCGTSVLGNPALRGSSVVNWAHAGEHSLIWCDPELIAQLDDLADRDRFASHETVHERVESLGLQRVATSRVRMQPTPSTVATPVDSTYDHRWLRADDHSHYELIKAFADRSDPHDAYEAALDDLDGIESFTEEAINVLAVAGGNLHELVAFASAGPWPMDPEFADIAVLVDPAHRGRGLGGQLVAHTVSKLHALGKIPLYRHDPENKGSQRIAERQGFEVVASLVHFARAV